MNARTISYAVTTGLVALGYAAAGTMYLADPGRIAEGFAKLGYPEHFLTLLGTWKLLGAAAIAAPGLRRLKEWAYAGMVFNLTGIPRPYPSRVEEALLRIGQEAVANAARHGHAEQIAVSVDYSDHVLSMRVSDNGCGFDLQAAARDTFGHYGLTIMRERADQIGATLTISTDTSSGTVVTATVAP